MKTVDIPLLERLAAEAAATPRGRSNFNLHPQLADPVQRMLNAIAPNSYVRPHRHSDPAKWELFILLAGEAVVLTFDDAGRVTGRCLLSARGPTRGVEIPAGSWHTVRSLAADTVLFEIKQGPYAPLQEREFAAWAPAENDSRRGALLEWFATATVGEAPPSG